MSKTSLSVMFLSVGQTSLVVGSPSFLFGFDKDGISVVSVAR